MRISVKARYGLSAMIYISQINSGECLKLIAISEKLKISKIYLEQVFSHLKHAELVLSTKGAHGGYQLARMPKDITALDIISAIETSLFEKTETTVSDNAKSIEDAMQKMVFDKLDACVIKSLSEVSLQDLAEEAQRQACGEGYMYYL